MTDAANDFLDYDFLDRAFAAQAAGDAATALDAGRRALALDPAAAAGLYLLGSLAGQSGDATAAVRLLRRATRQSPDSAAVRVQYALATLQQGTGRNNRTAWEQAQTAAALAPDFADAAEIGGLVRYRAADFGGAAGLLLRAHHLRPQKTETLISLGAALRDARLFDAAETVYSAAVARRPDLTDAWLGRAATRLVRGDYQNGWEDFERRWKRALPQPAWDGRRLSGETLYIYAEQGFGDAIQFARFIPLAADRGARVILEIHPALTRLLRRLDPRVAIHPSNAPPPQFDLHCPLMSLPLLLGAGPETPPAPGGRLIPNPAETARAAASVRAAGNALNVGVCWAGNPAHKNDHNRSLPPAFLPELLAVPGVAFWSLQTGPAAQNLPPNLDAALRPPPFALTDFAATAAFVAALDMVATVDTSIAHLAGALGVPCRLLLPYAPDWRWLIDREDTPWYPSLRLIRQPRPGDWGAATARTAALLAGVAAVRQARRENPSP